MKVRNAVSLYLQILINVPAPPPAQGLSFQDRDLLPDIIFLETSHLPISKSGSVFKNCIEVCLGLSTKCQAEDEVRDFLGTHSSPAKPSSQLSTPATSESQSQEEIRKQDSLSKRDARVLISFPPDFGLKGKNKSRDLEIFYRMEILRYSKIELFALMCSPKLGTKWSQDKYKVKAKG